MNDSNHHAPLEMFRDGDQDSLPGVLLTLDPALISAVQDRLACHGLLDPPADGYLGPVTRWALAEFGRRTGCEYDNALTRDMAAALLRPDPAFALTPGGDLAGRIVRAMQRRGDWVGRHPDCLTIVYLEGADEHGRPQERRPDAFDDQRILLRVDAQGRPAIAGMWVATTRPGRPATEQPAEDAGAPIIAPGQHKAWILGRTAVGTDLEHDALVQVAPLPVTRDAGQDYSRHGDERQVGIFEIDQHGGNDAPEHRVGGIGAGCLVGRNQREHNTFIAWLRTDVRWRMNNAYRFMTAVLAQPEWTASE